MSDVNFLRGRAEVYRRLAGNAPNLDTANDFLRMAGICEDQAAALERSLPQLRVSIRKHPAAPRTIRRYQPALRPA